MYDFFVIGTPTGQGSKRHVGGGTMIESAKGLPAWRRAVKAAGVLARGSNAALDVPLVCIVTFYIARPARPKFKDHPATPFDLDKLLRSTGDGLEQSGIIKNDSRIVRWEAEKVFATNITGAHIRIAPVSSVTD